MTEVSPSMLHFADSSVLQIIVPGNFNRNFVYLVKVMKLKQTIGIERWLGVRKNTKQIKFEGLVYAVCATLSVKMLV